MRNRPKVAVVLAGCGFKDGSEIREASLALLALDQAGAEIQCVAPAKELEEIDHLTGTPTGLKRSLLREAARIARGNICDLKELSSKDFDAVVLPGGFGAAVNLCTFAKEGANCSVDPSLEEFLNGFIQERKPIGAICIAPVIVAKVFQKHGGVKLTLGAESDASRAVEAMGSKHIPTKVDQIVADGDRLVVSTPAYMYGDAGLSGIFLGIQKLANQIVGYCKN